MAGKQKRKIKKRKVISPTAITPPAISKTISKSRYYIKGFFIGFITLLGVLGSISEVREWAKDIFYTKHEKYEEESFISGDLKGTKISDANFVSLPKYSMSEKPITLSINTINEGYPKINGILIKRFNDPEFINRGWIFSIPGNYIQTLYPKDLQKGIRLFSSIPSQCSSTNLVIGVIGDRLYVSTEFKDLAKEETIGIIEFNHWRLFKNNLLDFYSDDTRLEVRDKQNNIVFSLVYYEEPNQLHVAGYFINPNSILIIKNNQAGSAEMNRCISKSEPDWKIIATTEIAAIKSMRLIF